MTSNIFRADTPVTDNSGGKVEISGNAEIGKPKKRSSTVERNLFRSRT